MSKFKAVFGFAFMAMAFVALEGCTASTEDPVDDESADTTDESEQGYSASTVCANGQTLGVLQGRVNRLCKDTLVKACGLSLTCSETSRRTQVLANCVQARYDVMVYCFDGRNGRGTADQAHKNQLAFRTQQLQSCLNAENALVATGRCVRLPGGRVTDTR